MQLGPDPENDAVSVVPFVGETELGRHVEMFADGGFLYDPGA